MWRVALISLIFLILSQGWVVVIDRNGYEEVKDIEIIDNGLVVVGHVVYSKQVDGIVLFLDDSGSLEKYLRVDVGYDEYLTSICDLGNRIVIAGYVKGREKAGVIALSLSGKGDLIWGRIYNVKAKDLKIFSCSRLNNYLVLTGSVSTGGDMNALIAFLKEDGSLVNMTSFGTNLVEWVNSAYSTGGKLFLAGGALTDSSADLWLADFKRGRVYLFSEEGWQEAYSVNVRGDKILLVGSTSDGGWDVTALMIKGGEILWGKRYGTPYMDLGYDSWLGDSIYITGEVRCFGGGCNALLMELNEDGGLMSSTEVGGENMERGYALDSDGERVFIAGYSDSFSLDVWGGILVVSGRGGCKSEEINVTSFDENYDKRVLEAHVKLIEWNEEKTRVKLSQESPHVRNPCQTDLDRLMEIVVPLLAIMAFMITIYLSWRLIFKRSGESS